MGYREWAGRRQARRDPQRRGPLRPRRGRAHGLTPREHLISLAARSHRTGRGLRFDPGPFAPGPVACGGRGLKSRGPQNARQPRCDFSGNPKRVRGCYELAFRSLPRFLGATVREFCPNGFLVRTPPLAPPNLQKIVILG